MNNSINDAVDETVVKPLLDPSLANLLITTFTTITMSLSLPGIVFNAINVIVFWNMGTQDSVTICFLFLSAIDCLGMVILTSTSFFWFCSARACSFLIRYNSLSSVFSTVFTLLVDMTSATTTFIGLQRGLAVALPFTARHLFNRNKALMFVVSVILVSIILWLPRSIFFTVEMKWNPRYNTTTLVEVQKEHYQTGFQVYIILTKLVLGSAQYLTNIVCATFIYRGMQASLKLRAAKSTGAGDGSMGPSTATKGQGTSIKKEDIDDETANSVNESVNKKNTKRNDNRESLVIKQAFLVVLCQVLCSTPTNIAAFLIRFVAPFNTPAGIMFKIIMTLISGTYIFYGLNAFANFFIYLKFNTKFRTTIKAIFCRK